MYMATSQPKILWKVEFWQENQEQTPVRVAYVMARTERGAKNALKFRGFEQARQKGEVWLSHLFYRDDILVTATPDKQWADKQRAKQEAERQKAQLERRQICEGCGDALDDDYCQSCGWRRQSSWLDMALSKQGNIETNQEQ